MLGNFVTIFVLVTVMTAIGGCGSSSSDRSATSKSASSSVAHTTTLPAVKQVSATPLSRASLIRAGNSICAHLAADSNLIKVRSAAEFQLALQQTTGYQLSLYRKLSRLAPPASMAGEWNEMISDARAMAESSSAATKYQDVQRNPAARPYLARFVQARLRLRATAQRAGLRACGKY